MRCRSHLQPPAMVILSLVVLKKNTLRNDASLKQTRGKVRYPHRQSEDLSEKKRIEVAIAQLRSYDLATNTTLREIQKTSI